MAFLGDALRNSIMRPEFFLTIHIVSEFLELQKCGEYWLFGIGIWRAQSFHAIIFQIETFLTSVEVSYHEIITKSEAPLTSSNR